MNKQEQPPLKRSNVGLLHCDCCGLAIDAQAGEDCPSCGYPISPPKEKRFLTSAIRDLQRVATHGGANITVATLLRRYQARLNYLDQFDVAPAPASLPVVPPSKVASAEQVAPATWPAPPTAKPSEIVPSPAPFSPYEAEVSLPSIPYAGVVPPAPPVAPVARPARITPATPSVSPVGKSPEIAPPAPPIAPAAKPARITPATPSVSPVGKSPEIAPPGPPAPPLVPPARVAPARQPEPVVPVKQPMPAAPVRQSPSIHEVVFSWGAFFVDNAITVIGLLGAFLILLGTLSFAYINATAQSDNRLIPFLIVFGAHALFGILGIIAYRFQISRLIARIYIIIYALLLPLVGFTGYSLILGGAIHLTVPALIVIAAAYATIVYGLLAVYQGSVPFGYLGAVALAVVDLAIAQVFGLGYPYQWWPSALMILALPALVTVARSSSVSFGERIFAGRLTVLREPIRMLMFIIVGVCALGIILAASYSFLFGSFGGPVSIRGIRFSILSMMLLLSLWTSLYMWLTRRTKWVPVLVGLSLASVLAFCYAFEFGHVGYALALTGAALVYHGLNRFAPRLLQPFGKLGLRLDILALVLVSIIPIISEPRLPLRLLGQGIFNTSFGLSSPVIWATMGELIAVGAGLMLTISMALSRAALRGPSGTQRNAWPWLLLLSSALLNWEYSIIVLALHAIPAWCFLGLTLVLVVGADIVRRRFSSSWANPMDVLTLAEAILTLSLSLSQPDSLWALLLLSYGVVLCQRRQNWLFLPVAFTLLAFPILIVTHRLQVILLMGILLPLAAAAVRRLMPANLVTLGSGLPTNQRVTLGWEWPLLTIALLSGIIVSSFDVVSFVSTVHSRLGVPFPVAMELATFSLAWYVSAALARMKCWLLPVIGFAVAALLLPSNPFWVLAGVTFVSAVLAVGISRFVGREWASPLYIVTLLAAVMTGITGHTQHQLPATTWVLLGFALLVYIIGVLEDWTPWLWIMPVFAVWSLVDSAVVLRDLLRPPTLVLVCAAVGVAIGLLKLFAVRRNRFVRYVLPLYTTAFVAAVLTGVYGTLGSVNNPFPGAVPVALLLYAAVAYAVLLFERQSRWLGLVVGFAIWGTLLATRTASYAVLGIEITPAYDVVAIGIVAGIAGLLLSRVVKLPALNAVVSASGYNLVKFSWSWPWYVTALVAAIVTGVFASLPVAAWALLGFAVLFYIIGVVEDQVSWLWLAPALITWSRIDALLANDLYGLFAVTLVSVAVGVGIGVLKRFIPVFSNSTRGNRLLRYALPFYATALVSAVLTGINVTFSSIHPPFTGAFPAILLLYAVVAYGVLLFEHRPRWLALVAGFAIWGMLLALQTSVYYVFGIGIVTGIVGLLLGRVIKQSTSSTVTLPFMQTLTKLTWGWPWYVTALVAAIVTGIFAPLSAAAWTLLVFAVLAYVIGFVEDFAPCLWLAPAFATWSLIDSALQPDLVRLITVTLVCAAVGVTTGMLNRIMPSFFGSVQGNRRLRYALPFYATALVAAVLTGIDVTFSSIHPPFTVAFPAVLLLYAVVAYAVLLFERRPWWLGLVAGFAIWGTLLALQTNVYYVFGIGIVAGTAALLLSRLIKLPGLNAVVSVSGYDLVKLTWGWPWYVTALLAAIVTGVTGSLPVAAWALLGFAVLFYVIGVVEDQVSWLWLAPALVTWSRIDALLANDLYGLFAVTLVSVALGVGIGVLKRFVPVFSDSRGNRFALPFYATALVSAVLTGIDVTLPSIHPPFYGAFPAVLLFYAAVAYGVLLFERRPLWLALVAGFAIWATLLALQTSVYYVFGIGIATGIAGLLLGWVIKQAPSSTVTSPFIQSLVKFSWGWPWYVTALVAAIVTGLWSSLPLVQPVPGFIEYGLLGFAVLFYIIGVVEDFTPCLWLAPALVTWSRIDALLANDLYGLFVVTLVSVALGVGIGVLNRFVPAFSGSTRRNRLALPFYATALVGAVLTGIDVTFSSIHPPFTGAFPAVLLLYAVIAYAVLFFERRLWWLGLVAGFAIWGTLLALQTSVYYVFGIGIATGIVGLLLGRVIKQSTSSTVTLPFIQSLTKLTWGWPWYVTALVAAIVTGVFAPLSVAAWTLLVFAVLACVIGMVEDVALCLWLAPVLATWSLIDSTLQPDFWRLPAVALTCAVLAAVLSSLKRFVPQFRDSALGNRLPRYALPFYATALVAALLTGIDGMLFGLNQPFYGVMLVPGAIPVALLLYAVVAYGVLLVERVPEALVVPVGLAVWAIGQTGWVLWQLMAAYSLLCMLIFGSQFIWKVIPPATNWLPAALLHRIFGLGGQALVVLVIILQGGPFADSEPLAHVGAGALLVLAVLLFWYGRLQSTVAVQRWCAYSAGALLSLVVPWELLAFRQMNLDLLTLVPASSLVVIGPFLMREAGLPHHRRIGQVVSMLGAALLLLPTLWLSFSSGNNGNVLYTLILLGESLVLLLLGLGLRVRILILCGAGLIVVGALHALFLSTSSTPLALAGLGVILLLVATGLTLARRRLQAAWSRWQ